MDTNAANLASAVVTHSFGQLPAYIDGSLNMGANSLVLRPLPAGRHLLHVVVRQRIAGGPPATLVTDYVLRVRTPRR